MPRSTPPAVGRRTVLAAGAAVALTASCRFDAPSGRPALLPLNDPVHKLAWATENDVLLAFTSGSAPKRLIRIDPGSGETTGSLPADRAGENLTTDPHPREHVFLPEPLHDRVRVLAVDTLEELSRLDARAPRQLTYHSASFTLLTLSEDGSTVTGVNTEDDRVRFHLTVPGGVDAAVKTAGDRSEPAFWLIEPRALTRYTASEPPHRAATARVTVSHRTVSPSHDDSRLCYFAESGTRLIRKIDGGASGGGLTTLARRRLPAPVEHLESKDKDEFRVYAVTEDALVVLDAENLDVLDTIDFRRFLADRALPDARIADMTVGDQHVFLAVESEPYVLRLRKPSE